MLSIGSRIAFLRRQRKLTQTELAQRSGIPQASISNIEKGKRDFTVWTLVKLCQALGIDPAECFKKEAPPSQLDWTRSRIEKFAEAIWHPEKRLTPQEEELRQLFIQLVPEIQTPRISSKKSYWAWYLLRQRLDSHVIKVLTERIREKKPRRSFF